MSRTPADVPDVPPSDLTAAEREHLAELAARDAGGAFVPAHIVGLWRTILDESSVSDHHAADLAARQLVGSVRALLDQSAP